MNTVQKLFLRDFINNGNRTEESPIQSVIILVIKFDGKKDHQKLT